MLLTMIMAIENDEDRAIILNIYEHYYKAMYYKAYDILHDAGDAEDTVQDTILKLMQNIDTLKTIPAEDRVAYVMVAAKSTAINYWNARKRKNEKSHLGFAVDAAETIGNQHCEDDITVRIEDADRISQCLDRLSQHDRDVLIDRYVLDLDISEIAEKMNIEQVSVRANLSRARKNAFNLMKEVTSDD